MQTEFPRSGIRTTFTSYKNLATLLYFLFYLIHKVNFRVSVRHLVSVKVRLKITNYYLNLSIDVLNQIKPGFTTDNYSNDRPKNFF